MPASNPTLADGQVAATATALLTGVPGPVTATFCNTGDDDETLIVTVLRNGGTARRIAHAVLAADESLVIAGLQLNAADTLKAETTNASRVDYFVAVAPDTAPFQIYSLNEDGALKSGGAPALDQLLLLS